MNLFMMKLSIMMSIFLFVDLLIAVPNSSPIPTPSNPTNNPNCTTSSFIDDPNIDCLNDPGEQFLRKVTQATKQQETGGANCSTNGCKAKTANPFSPASFGSIQFTIATLLSGTDIETQDLIPNGLTQAQITNAVSRGNKAQTYFDNASASDNPAVPPALFTQETGLGVTDWAKIVNMKKFKALRSTVFTRLSQQNLSRNSTNFYNELTPAEDSNLTTYFTNLGLQRNNNYYVGANVYINMTIWNEAKNGLYNSAFLSNSSVENVVMDFFRDQSRFNPIADEFITEHIEKVTTNAQNLNYYKQATNESDADYGGKIAVITACMHNSGTNANRCKSSSATTYWYTKRPGGFLAKWDTVKNYTAAQACAL